MVVSATKSNDKLSVLLVGNRFHGKRPEDKTDPNAALIRSVDQTLEWASRIDANFFVTLPKGDENVVDEIKRKWDPYIVVHVLFLDACKSIGDVMRAVDKLDVIGKEFILIERLPTLCATNLKSNLENFKKLRSKDKNNVMSMMCSKSPAKSFMFLLEKGTNRLLKYGALNKDFTISLTKEDFFAGRIVCSNLTPTGIYLCSADIITQFSDNFDFSTMEHQISYILEHEEILCQKIHVEVLPQNFYADMLVERLIRDRTSFYQRTSRESSPDISQALWPEFVGTPQPKVHRRRSSGARRQKSTSTSKIQPPESKFIDVLYETSSASLQTFDEEIRESMKICLDTEAWSTEEKQRNLILEINSSKLAYNISMEDVAKHIFLAFLNQPKFQPPLADMKNLINGWSIVWKNFYKPEVSKMQILHAIEDYAAANLDWSKYAPNIVLFLFKEVGILTDTCIINWYAKLPTDHCLKNDKFAELVEWLNESSDEEDESDE